MRAAVAALLLALCLAATAGLRPKASRPRARAAGGPERESHALWLRAPRPRLISAPAQHGGEPVHQGSLRQALDRHKLSAGHWTQAYWRVNASLVQGGPAFVMLSGAADYQSDWLREGQMADLARKLGADRFFLTTRFFDRTYHPTMNATAESLQFLSVRHILLDVAYFLDGLLDEGILQRGQRVVLFGGGFGGALATWARIAFPDVVHAVVASSPTLEVTQDQDPFSYFPVVTQALNAVHLDDFDCERHQVDAFSQLEASMYQPEGRRLLNNLLLPCTPLAEDAELSAEDHAQVLGLAAGLVADLVQENEDGVSYQQRRGHDRLWPYCDRLANSPQPPIHSLADTLTSAFPGLCMETTFQGLVDKLSDADWQSDANAMGARQWLWLQCSELGQFPTSIGAADAFPYWGWIGMPFYTRLCDAVFGPEISQSRHDKTMKLQTLFGGKHPDVSYAIFVTGDLDPWKDLVPAEGLQGTELFVLNVAGASHAQDMLPAAARDPPCMAGTRGGTAAILKRWLGQPHPPAPRDPGQRRLGLRAARRPPRRWEALEERRGRAARRQHREAAAAARRTEEEAPQ